MKRDRLKTSIYLKSKRAVFRRLNGNSFDNISVKDICEEANFSRQYFYRHYVDKLDLVRDIMLEDFSRGMGTIFNVKKGTIEILKELQNNAWFYHAIFNSSYYAECYRLLHLIGKIIIRSLYKLSTLHEPSTEVTQKIEFYLHGVCATIVQYFTSGNTYDCENLTKLFSASFPAIQEKVMQEEITGDLLMYNIQRDIELERRKMKNN